MHLFPYSLSNFSFIEDAYIHKKFYYVELLNNSSRKSLKLFFSFWRIPGPDPTFHLQIVLCVKEQNEKTRVAAYKCLTAIGYVYLDKSQDKRLAMKSYIEMIIAGVTGQTHLARLDILSFVTF